MNDCIWIWINACEGKDCGNCTQRISGNGEKGNEISEAWEKEWEEKVKPLQDKAVKEFAKNNGFQEETK